MRSLWKSASREFRRDNLPGISLDKPWKFVLIPGIVLQWWMYMNPRRGFHGLVISARTARSPLMTYILSAAFWIGLIFLTVHLLVSRYSNAP
jgi:hypothetical protein